MPAAVSPAAPMPAPDQVIYIPRLPSPAELTSAAVAQGLTIEKIAQTSAQVAVVYRRADGQVSTVAYQLLPAAGSASTAPAATATFVPAPATAMYVPTPAPAVVYAAPEPVYYYDPFYYPWPWFSPVSLDIGIGYGFHYFGGGRGFRYYNGGHGGFRGGHGGFRGSHGRR